MFKQARTLFRVHSPAIRIRTQNIKYRQYYTVDYCVLYVRPRRDEAARERLEDYSDSQCMWDYLVEHTECAARRYGVSIFVVAIRRRVYAYCE